MPQAISEQTKKQIRNFILAGHGTPANAVPLFKVSKTSGKTYHKAKYRYLDSNECSPSQYRVRSSVFQQIEAVLCMWIYSHVGPFTHEDLERAAAKAWATKPVPGHDEPFYRSFVQRYKKKYAVKSHSRPQKYEIKRMYDLILRTAEEFPDRSDIYSVTDTRFFFRCPYSVHADSHFSVILGTNASGMHRFDPVAIGKNHYCPVRAGTSIENRGVHWDESRFSGVPPHILKAWLQTLFGQIAHRKVLLLLPSAYELVVQSMDAPENITILIFPRSMDTFQPLHQDLIDLFKIRYRMKVLRSIVRQHMDPCPASIDLLRRVWQEELESHVIKDGFSRAFSKTTSSVPTSKPDLERLYHRAQAAGAIPKELSLDDYLHPPEEVMATSEHVLAQVINWIYWDEEADD